MTLFNRIWGRKCVFKRKLFIFLGVSAFLVQVHISMFLIWLFFQWFSTPYYTASYLLIWRYIKQLDSMELSVLGPA